MRLTLFCCLLLLIVNLAQLPQAVGEPTEQVSLATYGQPLPTTADATSPEVERIRRIILNQGDDARALANLVQLTRKLPPATISQLYDDLASEYLSQGEYNQAANILQQLINQFPEQPISKAASLRLVRLYSSGEVLHTENLKATGRQTSRGKAGYSKYALHIANTASLKDRKLIENPAFSFQRSVSLRLEGRAKASLGSLTRLKRDLNAEPWRTYALAEHWLQSDRKDVAPMPTVVCRNTTQHPKLDGVLDEPFWNGDQTVQFAHNDAFIYLAISVPKDERCTYEPSSQTRTYDADLRAHDHVKLRLDIDRDYATSYELAVDHRGWANDRCWLDANWNLKWFIAAGGNDTHWTVEAAIRLKSLIYPAAQTGDAWTVAWERVLPNSPANSTVDNSTAPPKQSYSLLLFE